MSKDIRVEFLTEKRSEIPTIGQPKKVRVNGRAERKHVKRVEVEAVRDFDDGATASSLFYRGFYVLTDARGMWG